MQPAPHLMSSTREEIPSATFLLMMEEVIKPRLPTVLVISLAAYITLSAGQICPVWPTMQHPTSSIITMISSRLSCTLYPGMLSSLSRVPPVIPSPLPDIIGTFSPQAARAGARGRDTLSPTPPVLCLSTSNPSHSLGQVRVVPLSTMALVNQLVSCRDRPCTYTAMSQAPSWVSSTPPDTSSFTHLEISASDRGRPSRLQPIISGTVFIDIFSSLVEVNQAIL